MPRGGSNAGYAARHLPDCTFVLDNGAETIKAGFAPVHIQPDEETLARCHTIPNALVRSRDKKTYVASQIDQVTQWSEATFRRPVEHGLLVNWESEKEIWDRSFFDEKTAMADLLISNSEETTLVLTEAPNTIPALQKNADEIVMEEWAFGGYVRVVGPSLNAYNDVHAIFGNEVPKDSPTSALPMECLLLIDSGYSHTTITPLYKGRPLHRAIRRLDLGGKHLTNLLSEVVSLRHFDLHQDLKLVQDMKEEVCFVSQDLKTDMEKTWKGNKGRHKPLADDDRVVESADSNLAVDYVLPDFVNVLKGYSRPHDPSASATRKRKLAALQSTTAEDLQLSMTLANERFTIPEILFSPSDIGSKQPGLAECIMQSMSVLPPLVQATMLTNCLVVGGNAKMRGFVERLESDLRTLVKTEWTVKVRKMQDPITSTWLGGARLASGFKGVVQEWGITKQEYMEHGSAWVGRKFAEQGR